MKKKGFTLIELLAVIVILAIIALIATPIILSMINNARKSAAKSSAYGYIEAIESNNGFADAEVEGYTKIIDGTHDVSEISVPMKGKAPDSGSVEIEKGKVKNANICINGFTVTYNGHEAEVGSKCDSSSEPEVEFNGTYVAPTTGQTHKGIVYLDPKDLTATCDANSTITNTNTGCKKFYIYDDSGDTYKMIMDRNTTAKVAYETSGTYKEYDQATIKSTVDSDTTGWAGNPRLITADEIASITENSTFDGSSSTNFYFGSNDSTGYSSQTTEQKAKQQSYAWLFDYTNDCTSYGCNAADSSTYGYWTSSSVSDMLNSAWHVFRNGRLNYFNVATGNFCGVRPVITIQKSIIN